VNKANQSIADDSFSPEERLQLGILVTTSLLWQLCSGMLMPVLPAYGLSVGLDDKKIGLLVAIPSFAQVFSCLRPFTQHIVDNGTFHKRAR
jgi:hypothetical protein